MKIQRFIIVGAMWVACVTSTSTAQGFINLDFNHPDLSGLAARVPGGEPLLGRTSDLIPGWTLTADGVAMTTMDYFYYRSGGTIRPFNLVDSAYLGSPDNGMGPFYLFMESYRKPIDIHRGLDVRLTQRGTIPPDAVALSYIANDSVSLWIDDVKIGTASSLYTTFPVQQYAGKEVTLEFRFVPNSHSGFDIIGFVPEPEAVALFAVGGAAVALQLRRQRRGT